MLLGTVITKHTRLCVQPVIVIFLLCGKYGIMVIIVQHVEQLQAVMKSKFSSNNNAGIKVGFKLPDGNKTEFVFRENSTVKVFCVSTL